jgi:hypothetical protein
MHVLCSLQLLLAAVLVSLVHGQTTNDAACDYRYVTQPIDHSEIIMGASNSGIAYLPSPSSQGGQLCLPRARKRRLWIVL